MAPAPRGVPAPRPPANYGSGREPGNAGGFAGNRAGSEQHLSQWFNSHRGLSLPQQQAAIENEPGFRQLNPQEQYRIHNQITRLNSMSPEQRERAIARTEWMEHLAPGQRQQVRSAMAQLGSLPQDRAYLVGRTFHALQGMPEPQREAYLNSPQYRAQFTDGERSTIHNLLNVSPLLPPPNLGTNYGPPR